MKESPPSFARAIAIRSSDTDCMIAETIGILRVIGDSSSSGRYFTSGVLSETFAGMQFSSVYPGSRRYSLNVWDIPSRIIAISFSFIYGT